PAPTPSRCAPAAPARTSRSRSAPRWSRRWPPRGGGRPRGAASRSSTSPPTSCRSTGARWCAASTATSRSPPAGCRGPPRLREQPPAVRVAFLGPEGTFTSEAASRAAPDAERVALPTIDAVVDAVRRGEVDHGVVPIENSIEGSVNLTLDTLACGTPGALVRGEALG